MTDRTEKRIATMSIMSRTLKLTLAAVVASLALSLNAVRAQDSAPPPAPAGNPDQQSPPPAPQPGEPNQQGQPAQPGQPPANGAPGAEQPKGPTLDEAALAERFAEMAQSVLSNPNHPITDVTWKQA